MNLQNQSEHLQVYQACLTHTIKICLFFGTLFICFSLLFGYYIFKSYDVVPATITATQGMKAVSKAQRQSIKIQPGDSKNGRGKKSRR